jgi:hypothetical protein
MDNLILPELLLDNLLDDHEDIFGDSESESDDSVREKKTVWPEQSYSESETSSEKSDNTPNSGATTKNE